MYPTNISFGEALTHLKNGQKIGSTVTGWLASQTDLLAEDWEVVE